LLHLTSPWTALLEVPNGHLKLPISAHKTGQGASPMQVFAENGLMVLSRQINIPWPSVWIGQVVKATSNMANSMKQLASIHPSCCNDHQIISQNLGVVDEVPICKKIECPGARKSPGKRLKRFCRTIFTFKQLRHQLKGRRKNVVW